jgi:hypothetical protein
MAPFPALDVEELPIMFVAIIVAQTLDPQGRLKGEATRVATGMIHSFALTKLD